MVENTPHTDNGLPGYNEAINSSIYTIDVPESSAPPPPVFALPPESAPSEILASDTSGSPPQSGLEPPTYNSLFGADRPKVTTSPQQQQPDSAPASSTLTDSTASTESQAHSDSPSISCPDSSSIPCPDRSSISCPDCFSASCGSICDSEKAKNICKGVAYVTTIVACIVITAVGSIYSCLLNTSITFMLQISGISGLIYMVMLGLLVRCNDEYKRCRALMIYVFPLILTVLFFAGSYSTYDVWAHRPCNPGVGFGCKGYYCDDTLMLFSLIFYTTCMILGLPLWLTVLYILLRGILLVLVRGCCPQQHHRFDFNIQRIFKCFQYA